MAIVDLEESESSALMIPFPFENPIRVNFHVNEAEVRLFDTTSPPVEVGQQRYRSHDDSDTLIPQVPCPLRTFRSIKRMMANFFYSQTARWLWGITLLCIFIYCFYYAATLDHDKSKNSTLSTIAQPTSAPLLYFS